jgi:predicted TIM-barrel fold metal-dependent hydrolase
MTREEIKKTDKMKTAVEWLIEAMYQETYPFNPKYSKIFEQAKEMEKDNVCDAWDDGYDKGMRDRIEKISNPVGNAEQYYNQTFKSE